MYLQMWPQGAVPSVAEFLYIVSTRTEVFHIINDWLTRGSGTHNMLDYPKLYTAVLSFLHSPTDHGMPQSANTSDPRVEQARSTLTEHPPPVRINGQRRRQQNQSRDPPDIDHVDPKELVAVRTCFRVYAASMLVSTAPDARRPGSFLPVPINADLGQLQNITAPIKHPIIPVPNGGTVSRGKMSHGRRLF
ncbi:hypothetical protein B0H13DRAFT_1914984 [Mycena leptocephala]|nr:hypothetical protein B0H13DRAFT_1914984 [Mycena leptocephala]